MTSTEVRVDFFTSKVRDVPRIGQRKRTRVNGRLETLYVSKVVVEFTRVEVYGDLPESRFLGIRHDYSGTATLVPFENVKTVSE